MRAKTGCEINLLPAGTRARRVIDRDALPGLASIDEDAWVVVEQDTAHIIMSGAISEVGVVSRNIEALVSIIEAASVPTYRPKDLVQRASRCAYA